MEIIKIVDEEKAAFLRSGIPIATARVKQQNDARREEDEASKLFQYFPKITHVTQLHEPCAICPNNSSWMDSLGLKLTEEVPLEFSSCDKFPSLQSDDSIAEPVCCDCADIRA